MSMRTTSPSDYLANDPGAQRGAMPSYDTGEALSLIDRHSFFEGTYRSSRDLRIEGEVKGTIECQGTLHVAEGAQVDAHVQAESISVAGELSGEIICRGRLQIMPSGRLHGKVTTQTLVINEGAVYEGNLEMVVPDTSKRITSSSAAPPRPIASISSAPAPAQPTPAPQAQNTAPEQSASAPPSSRPAPAAQPTQLPKSSPASATSESSQPQTPSEPRQRPDTGFAPAGNNSSTFIRRLGGSEIPFGGRRDDDNEDDES